MDSHLKASQKRAKEAFRVTSYVFLCLRSRAPNHSHHPPTSNLEPARGPTCSLQSPLLQLRIGSQSQVFYRATFRFPRGHLDSAAPGPSAAAAACVLACAGIESRQSTGWKSGELPDLLHSIARAVLR